MMMGPRKIQDASNADDDDEDMDVLLGCKLVIAAAGLIGARRRRHIRRKRRAALYCDRRLVSGIYRGLGGMYF
jgi:hypothetical protein